MADVIYKKGQSINLDNVEITDGQILVTEDTGEMYVDMSDGTRKKISDNDKQDKLELIEEDVDNNQIILKGTIMKYSYDIVRQGGSGFITAGTVKTCEGTPGNTWYITTVEEYAPGQFHNFGFTCANPAFQGIPVGSAFALSHSAYETGPATLTYWVKVEIDVPVELKNVATPIENNDAVNKEYVDNFIKQETELKDTVIINNAGGSIDANKEHKIISTSVSGNNITISWSTDTGGTSGASCSFSSTTSDYIKNNIDRLDSITFMFAYDYMVPEENTGEAIIKFKSYNEIINAKMDKFAEVDKDNDGNIKLLLPDPISDPDTYETITPSFEISRNDGNVYFKIKDNSIETFSASDTDIISDTDLNLTTLSGDIAITSAKDISLQANNITVGKTTGETIPGAIHNVATPIASSPDTDAANKKYVDDATDALDTKINSLTSGRLTRQIVETLPPIDDGDESVIYMVGPKNNGTYDEYMKVQNGIVSESISNVGSRYSISPSLINFEQENGYYIIPDLTCKSVTGGVGQFNGTAASVSFGFNSNEEGERFAQFCQPNEIYTLKIKVDSSTSSIPNITEIKACKTGPAYELIGNTSVDLSNKQDKFAEYDSTYKCWILDDTFQLGSYGKSYLQLGESAAAIQGDQSAQLGIAKGVIGLTEQMKNNTPVLTLAMNGAAADRRITGITNVTEQFDVANKQYVDNEIVKNKYEILQTAIAGTEIMQTHGPMISGIYTVTVITNGGTTIGVEDTNGNSWALTVQNTNLNFSQGDQLLITTNSTGTIVGEILTVKEIEKQDKLQLIEEHVEHNTIELTGSIETIEQRTQSNCEYMGGSGQSTGTEYTVVKISENDTTATIYTTQAGLGFNFKYSGMLEMSIGDTFTLEKVDGTTGTLVMNDKFNIHINHISTKNTDVTIRGVKAPIANNDAANKAYVDTKQEKITDLYYYENIDGEYVEKPVTDFSQFSSRLKLTSLPGGGSTRIEELTAKNFKADNLVVTETLNMTDSGRITSLPDPVNDNDAVNKRYVDALLTKIEKLKAAIEALGGTVEE